jgi:hypothetical protein
VDYSANPFPEGDPARRAIWEMLVPRDIDAFLAQDWGMVADDFVAEGFMGLHAHFLDNPDSWRLGFPTVAAYRDEWLRQAAETAATAFAEPPRPALFQAMTLRDIDLGPAVGVARKKFDGQIARADGGVVRLRWQTLYFVRLEGGRWRIAGFVGYLPFPMGARAA